MFGGVPIASQGPMMMPPGFPGGGYPGLPTFQGSPSMGRPLMFPAQGPSFAQGGFQGGPGIKPAPTFNPPPRQPVLAQGPGFAPMPQPKFRGQAPEEPAAPRRLSLPAPEALGVRPPSAVASSPTIDWSATRERLSRLGAVSFRVDRVAGGTFRMVVLVPTQDPQRTRHVEAAAETEALAVQAALAQAEQVSRGH